MVYRQSIYWDWITGSGQDVTNDWCQRPDFNDHILQELTDGFNCKNANYLQAGDIIKTGTKLCILEAMKMENEITSPKNGTVTRIHIASGNNVKKGNLLMEISD